MARSTAYIDDLPWAFRVPLVGFTASLLFIGYIRSYGLLLIALQEERDYSHALLLFVYALAYALTGLLAPMAQRLCRRWTTRWVVCFGGLLVAVCLALQELLISQAAFLLLAGIGAGAGFAAIYSPSVGLVGVTFRRYRATATGFCFAGSSIGQMLLPALTVSLLEQYKTRGTFLIFGGIMTHMCVAGLLLPDRIVDKSTGETVLKQGEDRDDPAETSKVKSSSNFRTIFMKFLPYLPIVILVNFGYSNQHPIFPSFAEEYSYTQNSISFLIFLQGVCDLISRLFTGFIADRLTNNKKILFMGFALAIQASFLFLLLALPTPITFVAYVVAYGLTGGVYFVLWTVILAAFVGRKHLPQALALILMVADIVHLPGTYMVGYLRDQLDSFALLLWFLGGVILMAGILSFICLPLVLNRIEKKGLGSKVWRRNETETIPLLQSKTSRQ